MKMRSRALTPLVLYLFSILLLRGSADGEQCGTQAGGVVCPGRGGLCCSKLGLISSLPGEDITNLIPRSLFDQMLPHRNGFYTYEAFITAARFFPAFATTGSNDERKRELAGFFGQTSRQTTGGWPCAPNGTYAWGYYHVNSSDSGDKCDESYKEKWPCTPGKEYYGRGPIQLTYNYNYGPAGVAIGEDLLNNPELVGQDPVISFKTSIWFWMTKHEESMPSCHDVMTGNWTPSPAEIAANWLPGYGMTTYIITGGQGCGDGDRIGFYKKYCSDEIFGVNPGDNLDCNNYKTPSDNGLPSLATM